nr:MarR family transcriptional regulator [uncultured Caproiciproducens sp.]
MNTDIRSIVARLGQLNIIHRIYIHRAAAENNIFFGQLPILEYVEKHDRCTQRELAEQLQVSAPSITTSVKRMQKTGLLQKAADENDLRCTRITITEKGKKLSQQSRRAFDAVDARMFVGFADEECEQFRGYLNRLIANIATDEFKGRNMFSLIVTMTTEKKLHSANEGEDHL